VMMKKAVIGWTLIQWVNLFIRIPPVNSPIAG
jgi:hypothetical protein